MRVRLPILVLLALLGGLTILSSGNYGSAERADSSELVPGVAGPAALGTDAVGATWYCAGGTAEKGGFADHSVVVANPSDDELGGLLSVYTGSVLAPPGEPGRSTGGQRVPTTQEFRVPAHDQVRFRLADIVQAPLAAALVEVGHGGGAVEHWVHGPSGVDVAPCSSAAASSWHLAWGSTRRDAREVLVLFNPFASAVKVDGAFAAVNGERRDPLRWQGLTVPARSVVGVELGDDVTRRDQVSASLRSRGGRLIVDRLQTFDGSIDRAGLTLASGQPVEGRDFLFSHSNRTEADNPQVVLYNPGTNAAEVEVGVRGLAGGERTPEPFGIVVHPGQFEVIDYTADPRVPWDAAHAVSVRSLNGVPVVAERVVSSGRELAADTGALFAAPTWVFPGVVADPGGGQQSVRIVVANPDVEQAARASVAVMAGGQRTRPAGLQNVDMAPGGRVELEIPADDAAKTILVEADRPVTAERVVAAADGVIVAVSSGIPMATSEPDKAVVPLSHVWSARPPSSK